MMETVPYLPGAQSHGELDLQSEVKRDHDNTG